MLKFERPDVNVKDENGFPLLHVAAMSSKDPSDKCSLLHDRLKADSHASGPDNFTFFHAAASSLAPSKSLLQLAKTWGFDPDKKDSKNNTALHYAASSEHDNASSCVKYLLEIGHSVNERNQDNKTSLDLYLLRFLGYIDMFHISFIIWLA